METRKEKSTSQSSETIWSKVKIKLQQVYGEEEYSNWIKLLTLHSRLDIFTLWQTNIKPLERK